MEHHRVVELEVLKGRPRQDEAKTLLARIAKQVEPIMKKYKWRVERLCEFFPNNPGLLGMNCNRGQKILIRLRPHSSPDGFMPVEALIGTMLHELVHNEISAHDDRFYKMLDDLTAECEGMMAKGFNAFNDAHIPFDGQGQVLGSGEQVKARSKEDLRNAMAKAAEKRRQNEKRGTPSGGVRLGGAAGGDGKVPNLHDAMRRAAENRRLDHERCRTAQEQAAASAPTGDKDAWVCGVCTLRNGHHAVTCAACDSPKTAADSTQRAVVSTDDPGVADASVAAAKGGGSSGGSRGDVSGGGYGGGGDGGDGSGGNGGEREAKSAVTRARSEPAATRKPPTHAAAASKAPPPPPARTNRQPRPPSLSSHSLSSDDTHTRPPPSSSTTTIPRTAVHPHTRPPSSASVSIPSSSTTTTATTTHITTFNSSRIARAAQLLGPVGGWVCSAEACGRMNHTSSDRCSRCGMARTKKHNSGGGTRAAVPWDCELCTLRNAATADQCAVCGVRPPSPAGLHTPATSTSMPSSSNTTTTSRSGVACGSSSGGRGGGGGGGGDNGTGAGAGGYGTCGGGGGGGGSDGGADSRTGAVWVCTSCTLQNTPTCALCAACGTPRPWQRDEGGSIVVDLTDD